ncbi:MAG: metal-dependent hydrolase, partial [Gammaproteobacteria bacterium]|nr:metal-dependent hydrolase [Gammaproteobacteria bacterium]
SIPLSKWLGHRGAFHSFWLWGIVCAIGWLYWPAYYIGGGAVLHIVADCATVSGVRAMTPWSTKLFVFFRRSWRFRTGGNAEFGILLVFGIFAWTGHQIGTMGGLTATIGYLTGSPKLMQEEYRLSGLKKCFVKGKFRWNSGKTEQVRWLVIGSEGTGLAFHSAEGIIRTPGNGKFIRARLEVTKEQWVTANLKGWYQTDNNCYFLNSKKWHLAEEGDIVWGIVLADRLSLSDDEVKLSLVENKDLDFEDVDLYSPDEP